MKDFRAWQKDKKLAGAERRHPRWIRQGEPDTVIVFIHGLLSNGRDCWMAQNGAYWPDLLQNDADAPLASIFVAEYYTAVDSGRFDVPQCARSVFDSLREPTNGRSVLDHSNILLVCHSLGGVIARRMLDENSGAFKNKHIGLVLLASPSLGSDYAGWVKHLAALYGNKTVQMLVPTNELLLDLDERFRALLAEKRIPSLVGAEACENHSPAHKSWFPSLFKKIVEPASGARYFGPTKIMEKTDHSTIVKPDDAFHPTHRFVKQFFREKFLPKLEGIAQAKTQLGPPVQAAKSALVLFDVYTAACQPYYVRRESDIEVIQTLQMGNAWLTGESGSGKTALVRHGLDMLGVQRIEVSLGHREQAMSSQDLWEEIGAALVPPNPKATMMDIARTLFAQKTSLFLDEVPISSSPESALPVAIRSLSEAVRRVSSGRNSLVVCSISAPATAGWGTKFLEHLHINAVPLWNESQLLELALVIERELPSLSGVATFKAKVIAAASGAPRFVKSFYRRRFREGTRETPEQSLARTSESFVQHER